jgi:hypothetical protein
MAYLHAYLPQNGAEQMGNPGLRCDKKKDGSANSACRLRAMGVHNK